MDKAIVLIDPNGTETVLEALPTWQALRALLGGEVELVRVVDRVEDDGRLVYTAMFVDEEGLLKDLPRNDVATAIYQRNVRLQFPGADNPFAEAAVAWRRSFPAGAIFEDWTPPAALERGHADDPWIAGKAIYFRGYDLAEVDALFGGGGNGP